MNRVKLGIVSAGLAAVIAAACWYLFSDLGESPASADSEAGGALAIPNSVVRKDTSTKPVDAPEKINPLDYSTAPKPGTVERKLVDIFSDRQLPDSEKVERLLGLFLSLPEHGKSIALDYATQLIPDADYVRQRPRLLRLANTDALREVVMLDMLTRDDGIKMTSLVELLSVPSATTRGEAREILEAFLEQDYGDDPRKWDAPIRQWLAENADA